MNIYLPCDIRGHATEDLTPELYRHWGRTLGSRLQPRDKFVVGGDVRKSTAAFQAALIEGLRELGLDVVDLGCVPTPMVDYARRRLGAAGSAMVTGAHSPSEINGLKWMLGDTPPSPEDIAWMESAVASGGSGSAARQDGTVRPLDISFDYVAWLQETWVDALSAHGHIVLDPMHGCWSGRIRRYMHAIFPQSLFLSIHDHPAADFAGCRPDCSHPEHLHALCDAVYRHRADLGLAFDGDGDRLAVVDNEGIALTAEELSWILLQSFGDRLQGRPFVYDLKFSDRIAEAAAGQGATPLVERSGHGFVHRRMQQLGAPFGAEVSGHYFFDALDGGEDALFAACWLFAWLAQREETLADWRRRCPAVYMTPDLRLAVSPEMQAEVLQRVSGAWSGFPQKTFDGLRVDTPAGWGLVRSSVTEAALTFRFEAIDWSALDDLVDRFCQSLGDLGDQLWTRYQVAMGHGSHSGG